MSAFTLCGTVIHAPLCGEVEILEAALVEVDDDGQILAVLGAGSSDYDSARKRALQSGQLQELSNTQYLLPGLIDWPSAHEAGPVPTKLCKTARFSISACFEC